MLYNGAPTAPWILKLKIQTSLKDVLWFKNSFSSWKGSGDIHPKRLPNKPLDFFCEFLHVPVVPGILVFGSLIFHTNVKYKKAVFKSKVELVEP